MRREESGERARASPRDAPPKVDFDAEWIPDRGPIKPGLVLDDGVLVLDDANGIGCSSYENLLADSPARVWCRGTKNQQLPTILKAIRYSIDNNNQLA